MRDIPRVAVVPTHNRPMELARLLHALTPQCDVVIVIDNASDPPVVPHEAVLSGWPRVIGIRDEEQPPNLSRLWNLGLETASEICALNHPRWDVGVFNDDANVPAGWWDAVSGPLRAHPTAVVGHTHTYGDPHRPAVFRDSSAPMDLHERMCPWAFVTKGEEGLRSDERMRWWWFDTDFEVRARALGGVLAAPGPQVPNTGANTSTVGALAEQAGRDRRTFIEIYGGAPW